MKTCLNMVQYPSDWVTTLWFSALVEEFQSVILRAIIRPKSDYWRTSVQKYFLDKLSRADWNSCFLSTCVNSAWKSFQNIFSNVLDEVAPVKEIRLKQRTEPWMSSEILELIHSRDKFLYSFKKSGIQEEYKRFCEIRNKVQREIKKAISDYFSNQIDEDKENPRKLWKHLNDIGLKGKQKDDSSICLNIDGDICHDSKSVANHFNNFLPPLLHL